MLAFSVGGLLGDVFLHLLPEAWSRARQQGQSLMPLGLHVVAGLFAFTLIEVLLTERAPQVPDGKGPLSSSTCRRRVSSCSDAEADQHASPKDSCRRVEGPSAPAAASPIAGYLNVVANGIDNFSHGLAVAASFLAGPRIGFLTTAAILLHEVPHEFGDYVILMRSGFSKWQAGKAQAWTASIGLLGAVTALTADAATLGDRTAWILPFTAGGFMHIALVHLLPDLMAEDGEDVDEHEDQKMKQESGAGRQARASLLQILAVAAGIGVMAGVNCLS